MRLHLVISRHGLPATRILWTTTSSSAVGEYGAHRAASTAAISSSRTPNIAFANGGYTVAQLLEDVNEVVPLETEPSMFDPEFSGQWGLEDYVVEVGGSECLHFMEVDGLLREGDEVVIRALQLADLRARRLCGRHQITAEGKHLIDGVPFGLPFLKRTTSARPAITIPPRKKRRTVFSGWEAIPQHGYGYEDPNPNADEEGDGEWLPPSDTGFGKELSVLPADQEVSDMGTVIRHHVDYSADTDSEAGAYEPEEDELESELKALKEDFEEPASQFIDIRNQGQVATGPALRSSSVTKRPSSSDTLRRGSLVGASSLSSKRSRGEDLSPRASKAVRFNKGDSEPPDTLQPKLAQPEELVADISESESEEASSSSSDSSASSSSDEEDSSDEEVASDSSSGSDDSSPVSSSEESTSESEEEEVSPPLQKAHPRPIVNAPGRGSVRTKKSNHRYKLRRRLSKLKELGVLPPEADFTALRAWEEANGGWHFPDESSMMSTTMTKELKKEQEQLDFEAKRQKLLRDLDLGGVDVDETSEKENVPPRPATTESAAPEETVESEELGTEPTNRRHLDIASSRRLLFGSLGMRTPKTKEDEEAARRKLAAQASVVQPQMKPSGKPVVEEAEGESDVDWENKLVIKATECIYDDIELSPPSFPFENRWDEDADAIIRQRKGWGKKRKRKQRIQVYNGDADQDEYEDPNDAYEGNIELNYDDEWPACEDDHAENYQEKATDVSDDLPVLPLDSDSVADLLECEAKVGAIIAFRQLDMSKDTNWQPQMSKYRVAEVHNVLGNGTIKVRLAVRDRRPKAQTVDSEDDEPRQYSGFEMPGFEDDEGEDGGYRELAFAELSDPKLLRPAPLVIEDDTEDKDKDAAREGSIVSVVEDSMPNAQPAPPPVDPADMDLDETTFVTLVTAISRTHSPHESPTRTSEVPPIHTPGGVRPPHTQGQDADDEHSDSPAVPSPSFSGFHSARSSPGTRLGDRFNGELEEMDGHTLVGEQQSILAGNSNQDYSALSFVSANQSTSDQPPESQQQDRQVVDQSQFAPTTESGGNDSLLSVVQPQPNSHSSAKSSPVREPIQESPEPRKESPPKGSASWESILDMLRSGQPEQDNTDQDKDEPDDDLNDDRDSLVHSGESLHLSPRPSPPPVSSRSSRKAPTSGQRPQSQKSNPDTTESPAASTRSKKPILPSNSQPNPTQTSEIIDLTTSPLPSHQEISPSARKSRADESGWVSKSDGDDDALSHSSGRHAHPSTGKMQRMAEVSISPASSQKKSKKRTSRKF